MLGKNGNGNVEWRISQSEFKGFVKAKLEDMEKDIKVIDNHLLSLDEFKTKISNRVTAITVTLTIIMNALWLGVKYLLN